MEGLQEWYSESEVATLIQQARMEERSRAYSETLHLLKSAHDPVSALATALESIEITLRYERDTHPQKFGFWSRAIASILNRHQSPQEARTDEEGSKG